MVTPDSPTMATNTTPNPETNPETETMSRDVRVLLRVLALAHRRMDERGYRSGARR